MFTKEEVELLPEEKRELFVEDGGVFVPKSMLDVANENKTLKEQQAEAAAKATAEMAEKEKKLKEELETKYQNDLAKAIEKHGSSSEEVRKILEEKHKHEIEQARLAGATEKEQEFTLKMLESSVTSHREKIASLGADAKKQRLLTAMARDLIKIVDGKETFFDVDGKALSYATVEEFIEHVKKDESFDDLLSAEVKSFSPEFSKKNQSKQDGNKPPSTATSNYMANLKA